jgi:hypothetical protein
MWGAMPKRTLRDLDQDPEAALAEWREAIGDSVHLRVERYTKAIGGLKKIDHSQFEQLVVDALLWCAVTHLDAPNRKHHSEIRKELLAVKREAAAAEKSLDRLRDALSKLEPQYRELLAGRLDLTAKIAVSLVAKQAPWFSALSTVSSVADTYAEVLKGKGGAPKMVAFGALIGGLKRAFESATGKPAKATWNAYRTKYEGKFLGLVEAVLPLALVVACHSQPPMRHPESAQARGKYIYEATRTKKKRTAPAMPKTPNQAS